MVLGYIGLRAYELYEAWRIGQMSVSTAWTFLNCLSSRSCCTAQHGSQAFTDLPAGRHDRRSRGRSCSARSFSNSSSGLAAPQRGV